MRETAGNWVGRFYARDRAIQPLHKVHQSIWHLVGMEPITLKNGRTNSKKQTLNYNLIVTPFTRWFRSRNYIFTWKSDLLEKLILIDLTSYWLFYKQKLFLKVCFKLVIPVCFRVSMQHCFNHVYLISSTLNTTGLLNLCFTLLCQIYITYVRLLQFFRFYFKVEFRMHHITQ